MKRIPTLLGLVGKDFVTQRLPVRSGTFVTSQRLQPG